MTPEEQEQDLIDLQVFEEKERLQEMGLDLLP